MTTSRIGRARQRVYKFSKGQIGGSLPWWSLLRVWYGECQGGKVLPGGKQYSDVKVYILAVRFSSRRINLGHNARTFEDRTTTENGTAAARSGPSQLRGLEI